MKAFQNNTGTAASISASTSFMDSFTGKLSRSVLHTCIETLDLDAELFIVVMIIVVMKFDMDRIPYVPH